MAKREKEKKASKKKGKEKSKKKAARTERSLLGELTAGAGDLVRTSAASIPSASEATTWSTELASRLTHLASQNARGLVGSVEHAAGEVAAFIDARITALIDELRREYRVSRSEAATASEGQTAAGTEAAVLPSSGAGPESTEEEPERAPRRRPTTRTKGSPRKSSARPAAQGGTKRPATVKGGAKRSATKSAAGRTEGKTGTTTSAAKGTTRRARTRQGES